jgi:hypothetical protein
MKIKNTFLMAKKNTNRNIKIILGFRSLRFKATLKKGIYLTVLESFKKIKFASGKINPTPSISRNPEQSERKKNL